ncbi:hypothetical protein U9M48_020679 [Paspalum notatum var. saurae]|uniref:Protein kinase domain-containing protein n=1 Tax=Paspalum notatum var. saurae TaxID=547442 RepID=A0AAQ3WSA9_PASNO
MNATSPLTNLGSTILNLEMLLVSLLLLLHHHALADCEPATCGNLTVRYPFWLGTINQSSSPCGHPAFEILCSDDGSSASLKGSAIHVLDVDYSNNSFVASDTRIAVGDDGVCRADFNMSSSIALSTFTISSRNRALCFLYSCNGTEPLGAGYVNATSNCSAPVFAYLGGSYNWDNPPAIATGRCTLSYVPVLGPEAAATTAANYSRLLKDGFVLEWAAATVGDCSACNASGGQCRYDNAAAALACHCPDGNLQGSTCAKDVLMGATASLLFPCICVLIRKRSVKRLWFLLGEKTRSTSERNIEALIVSYRSLAPKRYRYSEVVNITSSLNNKLGEGGYGMVYKGRLYDGRLVAVKFLRECKGNGEEFVNEVMSIGRTSHVNIVNLFGFCLESSKRALIYEYMPNGSLDQYIYSENPKETLGWQKLYTIAIGIARGLEYLHHSCNTRIVHFDIKPQNILLDQDFCPKIADFGLAKLCHTKESKFYVTGARGTIGFIAPEVHSRTFGAVSTKSDVYGYGMMLLEMVGGRKNVKSMVQKSSEKYFPDWIHDHFAQHDGLQVCEVTSEVEEIARKMTLIGLWCIQILPMHRPTITQVLDMFERSLDKLDMPPKQNFSQILEDSVRNLNTESTCPSSSTKTLGSIEAPEVEEINLVDIFLHTKVMEQSKDWRAASTLSHVAATELDDQGANCLPKSCGNLTISDPFGFVPEQATDTKCGRLGFEVHCNNSIPYLGYYRKKYRFRILDIFYDNSSLLVADTHKLGDFTGSNSKGCHVLTANTSSKVELPFSISPVNLNLIFYNCTKIAPEVDRGLVETKCGNSLFVRVGGHYNDSSNYTQYSVEGCSTTLVPVLGAFGNASANSYEELISDGFLLTWQPPSGNLHKNLHVYRTIDGWKIFNTTSVYFHGWFSFFCFNILGSMSATAGLVFTCLVWIICRWKPKISLFIFPKHAQGKSSTEEIIRRYQSLIPKRYSYSDLKKITNYFKEKLGEGGYGTVFKGNLPDGRMVAVKLLKGSKRNGEEFLNEVTSIGRTSHVNVVSLLGFCLQGSKRALVYEYMANGSLEKYIYSESSKSALGWENLRKIAIGIARGLEYLHQGCSTRIIHFDIKPHNILLDENFCPKIADFGLAKLCHLKDSALSMAEARGTIGFIAPEVFYRGFGVVSTKSDVYSYGMMILEIVRGRTSGSENTENSSEMYFTNWIDDCLVKDLQGQEVTCELEEAARQMALVGLWCIQMAPGNPAAAATTTCEPRTCGNLTIAYPFWLPADSDNPSSSSSSSPAQCGPAAFEVDCTGGRATLARSFRGAYKLLRVSYAARTVVVANDNVQTDARGCPVPRIDVSASLSLAPFAASPANAQLVFLFNCTGGGGRAAAGGFVNATACPAAPRAVVRLDPAYNATEARAAAGGCDYSVVPVLGAPGATAGDYPRLLRDGYLLDWTAAPGDCAACSASGGSCGYDSEADAFACICDDGSARPARCGMQMSCCLLQTSFFENTDTNFSPTDTVRFSISVSLSITFSLLLALLIIILKFRRRMHSFSLFSFMDRSSRSDTANVEKLLQKYGSLAPKRYRYSELKKITESFKHKLGEGGYGAVFSGVLPAAAGNRAAREVAVKFLHHSRPNGEEFLNEVISIGRTSHVNIVTLLGFCLEGSKRALVYEYMPNGSLDRYIYGGDAAGSPGTAALGWEALHEIAVGIARGLEYLHEGCNTRIIHFDIKPQNVLLDADLRPKIADFGMAKLCSPQESILSMADARGTIGFIAPEVFSRGFGVISTKSDVYSYGMLLLEMVGGRSNVKAYAEKSSGELFFFPLWVYDHLLQDGGVLQLHDGAAEPGEEIARKMALIGLWCIQTVPASRPSMSRVMEMLEKSVHELAMPPRPYHASPSNSPSPSYPSSYPSSTSAFTQRCVYLHIALYDRCLRIAITDFERIKPFLQHFIKTGRLKIGWQQIGFVYIGERGKYKERNQSPM